LFKNTDAMLSISYSLLYCISNDEYENAKSLETNYIKEYRTI